MNTPMNPQDIQKQLERIHAPEVEVPNHRDQLRRALLQSHESATRSRFFSAGSWAKVMVPLVGVMAIGVIAIVLAKPQSTQVNPEQVAQQTGGTKAGNIASVFGVRGAQAAPFAVYAEVPVTIHPQLTPYSVLENLQNVSMPTDFVFSDAQVDALEKNAFVVKPSTWNEFFSLYEQNRYANYPSFITTDSILHNYHLVFDATLKSLEKGELRTQLKKMTSQALTAAQSQYAIAKGTEWENAARRNVVFFAVAQHVIDPAASVPTEVAAVVNAESALIMNHAGVAQSPMMQLFQTTYNEDYSQYVPRGHYTQTQELQDYFRAMMWYGRMTFRFKQDDEIRSAVLQAQLLNSDAVHDPWAVMYDTTTFFIGESDDITYPAFKKVVEDAYGKNATLSNMISNTEAFAAVVAAAKAMPAPQVNSMAVGEGLSEEEHAAEIHGFRFMGQRFTLDAAIFQQLVCNAVGNKRGTAECGGSIPDSRMLPKGLDIPASMGSDAALDVLTQEGDTDYFHYIDNMTTIRGMVNALDTKTWTQNIYWAWLYALQPLTQTATEGYPTFMQNSAWALRDVNTYLGSWTELKHDTVLYAKQAYAEFGGGVDDEIKTLGYVEPRPVAYARLAALMQMTSEGLELRGLLTPEMKEDLNRMRTLTLALKTISEKELNNEPRTADEYELIRSYGGQLEHFWLEANKKEMADSGLDARDFLVQNPSAIVADVATDPNGKVLEEATGGLSEVYVVVPVDRKLVMTRGAQYSYYEFTQPIEDRLTDEAWRQMLLSDDAPTLPTWTSAFIVQ